MVVELVQHLTLHLHQILMQFKALLVLEGVVVEQGTYDELVELGGLFHSLTTKRPKPDESPSAGATTTPRADDRSRAARPAQHPRARGTES